MTFRLKLATEDDFDFLFELNKITMMDHVVQTWGKWNEDWQRNYFREKFVPSEHQLIMVGDKRAGGMSTKRDNTSIEIDRLQIMPEFQNAGIGTMILDNLIKEAWNTQKKLSLTVLKTNTRAKELYERKGFRISGENKERYFMIYKGAV